MLNKKKTCRTFTKMVIGDLLASGYNEAWYELPQNVSLERLARKIRSECLDIAVSESDDDEDVIVNTTWIGIVDWMTVAKAIRKAP